MMTPMDRQLFTFKLSSLAGALLLACVTAFTPPVSAHAIVMASTPVAGATVEAGSRRCELRFNNRIDGKRSRLVLAGPLGGPGAPIPEQALTLLEAPGPDVLVTELKLEASGQYRLRWQVLALDGHVTRGEVPFSVTPPAR